MSIRPLLFTVAALLLSRWACADEISLVSTVGVQGLLERVRNDFEHQSGHRLQVSYGTSAVIKRELEQGRRFDVVILTRVLVDDLAAQGKVAAGTATPFVTTGVGIAAAAGAPKPRIDTPDALRAALLAAKTVGYTKEGQSGTAAAHAFEQLGIAEQIKERIYLDQRPAGGVLAVADGKAALGFALLSEIAAGERVQLVGPLPADLQVAVAFVAAAAPASQDAAPTRALLAYLQGPAIDRALPGTGLARR